MADINLVQIIQQFPDDDTAREFLEKMRWPNGAVCPHCGYVKAYKITSKPGSKTRKGLYKCKDCRKQFTVTVGTIFEASHIKLDKWFVAIYLMGASKKGISAHQLHGMLGITYKTAWFMCHRIRYSMDQSLFAEKLNEILKAGDTYIGEKYRGGKQECGSDNNPLFFL